MAICQLLAALLHQDQSELEAPFTPKQAPTPACHLQFRRKVDPVGVVDLELISTDTWTRNHPVARLYCPSSQSVPWSRLSERDLVITGFLALGS